MSFSEANWVQLTRGVDALGLTLSATQVDQLQTYAQLILKWNGVYNLTALKQPADVVTHHLLDSLAAVPVLDRFLNEREPWRLLDVGSGAGLPGLVFSIARPALHVTTLDTVQKKAIFMQQAIAQLGLTHARAVKGRIESHQDANGYHVITSRAFSTLNDLVRLSAHLLAPGGCFLALKGKRETDEQVPEGWRIAALEQLKVPFLPEERNLFVITR